MIHWPTVAFQVLNFLLLVWLMKKFLYGRILDAMDARQQKIADQIAQAEARHKEAEAEAASYKEKLADLDAQKEAMLAKAAEEAAAHKKDLTDKARAEVDALRARWRESVDRDRTSFLEDLRYRATEQTFALARQVLRDLSGKDVDVDVVDVFVRHFEQLDETERKALVEPGDDPDTLAPVVCRTAFDLAEDRQKQIVDLIHTHVDEKAPVAFETAPELVSGIELKAKGHKVAWSADSYLQALEEELDVLLDQGSLAPKPEEEETSKEPATEEPQAKDEPEQVETDKAEGAE